MINNEFENMFIGTYKPSFFQFYSIYYLFLFYIKLFYYIELLIYNISNNIKYDKNNNFIYNIDNIYKISNVNYIYSNTIECNIIKRFLSIVKIIFIYTIKNIYNTRRPFLSIINNNIENKNFERYYIIDNIDNNYENITYDIYTILKNNKNYIFYVHGGGFVSGDYSCYRSFCNYLAYNSNTNVIFPQYKLLPEAKSIENQVKELNKIYNWMIQKFNPKNIICIGDSAGGNLITLMIQYGIKKNPNKLILISPVTDMSCKWNYLLNNDKDLIIKKEVAYYFFNEINKISYINPKHSKVSCIYGDFTKLNNISIVIFVDKDELFYLDSYRFIKKYNKFNNNKNIDLYIGINLFHTWVLFWKYIPESKKTIDIICNHIINI